MIEKSANGNGVKTTSHSRWRGKLIDSSCIARTDWGRMKIDHKDRFRVFLSETEDGRRWSKWHVYSCTGSATYENAREWLDHNQVCMVSLPVKLIDPFTSPYKRQVQLPCEYAACDVISYTIFISVGRFAAEVFICWPVLKLVSSAHKGCLHFYHLCFIKFVSRSLEILATSSCLQLYSINFCLFTIV